MNSTAPTVSVCTVTWNHRRYLRQAVESVQAQKGTDWELVLGVDRCADGTLEIARELAAEDSRIRLFEPDAKQLGAIPNFMRTLDAARGRYIAWLDGDDFFSDDEKLMKQVAHLDAHPEQSGCIHDAAVVGPDGEKFEDTFVPYGKKAAYGPGDIARDNVAQSSTIFFRREHIVPLPDWMPRLPVTDWPLVAHLCMRGPLGYQPGCWSTYRRQPEGIWTSLGADGRLDAHTRVRDCLEEEILGKEHAAEIAIGRDLDLMRCARDHEQIGNYSRSLELLDELRRRGAPGRSLPSVRFWKRYARVRLRALFGDKPAEEVEARS